MIRLLIYGMGLFYLTAINIACTPFKKPSSTDIKVIKVDLLNKPRMPVNANSAITPIVGAKSPVVATDISQTVPIRRDAPSPPDELTGIYDTGQFMSPPLIDNLAQPAEIRFQAIPESSESSELLESDNLHNVNRDLLKPDLFPESVRN